jgi:hypothetical protein
MTTAAALLQGGLPAEYLPAALELLAGNQTPSSLASPLVDCASGVVTAAGALASARGPSVSGGAGCAPTLQLVPHAWVFTLHDARPALLRDGDLLNRVEAALGITAPVAGRGLGLAAGSDGPGPSLSASPGLLSPAERVDALWPRLWSAAVCIASGDEGAKEGKALGVRLMPTMALPGLPLQHRLGLQGAVTPDHPDAGDGPALGLLPVVARALPAPAAQDPTPSTPAGSVEEAPGEVEESLKVGTGASAPPGPHPPCAPGAAVLACLLWARRPLVAGEPASVDLLGGAAADGPHKAALTALHQRARAGGWRHGGTPGGDAGPRGVVSSRVPGPPPPEGGVPPPSSHLLRDARRPLQVSPSPPPLPPPSVICSVSVFLGVTL